MGSHSYYDYKSNGPGCAWFFICIAGLLCMLFMFSCSPTKRIGGIAAKHPNEARKVFVSMFPPEVKTVTNTEYIHGKEVVRIDTVTGDCDPVIKYIDGKPVKVVQKVRVPCPPSVSRVDTFVKTETRTIENKAKIDVLEADLAKSKAEEEQAKKGRQMWRWIAIGALVAILGGAILKLKKIL